MIDSLAADVFKLRFIPFYQLPKGSKP